ncbi:Oar protein [Shewanella sp. c952]|uniref:TonB-dependent receptor n=1 Tax=Shewanella sp. c952 TaxID=2815913 RepID=UPI001BBD9BC2|nr:TonB-dependent receptor [Shewanella sp. c952]GIU07123.1 Oar protein [Shewanella sp. c952]
MKTVNFKRSLLAVSISTLLAMSSAVKAEDIFGKVDINNGSIEGYTVKATNIDTGTTRSIQLDNDGRYRIPKLPSGNYKVTISKGNTVFAEQQYKVQLGANTNANFSINSGTDIEVLEVSGARISTIDISSSDSGLTIGADELDMLPVGRSLAEVARLAPGVVKGDAAFGSDANSFGGSSAAENACYINGLEVTNTRQGLGCGEVPYEFYKEFQIKTGGYSAKFGRATGGTINTITKSGTNEWEFDATLQWEPDALREEGRVSKGNNGAGDVFRDHSKNSYDKLDVTLSVAGPLIEDKLFFYGLVAPQKKDQSWTTGGSEFAAVNIYRERETEAKDSLFWGSKIDWDITDDHRLSYFGYSNRADSTQSDYEYDANTGTIGNLVDTALVKRGGEAHSLSYTGFITDDFNVSAMAGQIKTEYETQNSNLECASVSDERVVQNPAAVSCGAGGSFGANNDENTQYRLDLEYSIGDHLISAGVDYQERLSERVSRPIGGHSWTYKTLAPGAYFEADNGRVYNNTDADMDYVEDRVFDGGGAFSSELLAYYLEDQWQVTDNVLLNIGFRVDQFESVGTTGKVLTDFTTDIAPRLGATWDINGDGESKLYATVGRYYLPVANNTVFRAASGVSDITTAYSFAGIDSANGTPTGINPLAGNQADSQQVSGVPTIPEKGIFQAQEAEPFSKDEFIIGYDQILNDEYTFGIKGTYRNVGTALDDYCGRYAYPYCVLINPGDDMSWYADGYYWNGTDWGDSSFENDGIPDEGSLETYSAETIGLPEAENKYLAVDTQFNYRDDKLSYSFTYTWSKSYGNFEGAVKSDIGQADAGITQDFDFPAVMDGSDGYQPNDRRHVFKFFGSYEVVEDLSLGWNALLSSGRPLSLFGQSYPSDDPNLNGGWGDKFWIYDAENDTYQFNRRGTNGRTPWTFNLDLSAAYNFNISEVDMRVSLNVFNILNTQEPTALNEHYEATSGTVNPFHNAAYTYQTPRYVRIGLEARF